jgi:hypothetical protein
MHAFVSTFCWGPRLDAFDLNTEPELPDRQIAQIGDGVGGSEWHTVAERMLRGNSHSRKSFPKAVKARTIAVAFDTQSDSSQLMLSAGCSLYANDTYTSNILITKRKQA